MTCATTTSEKWNEAQIVAAFRQFRNPNSGVDDERADEKLRNLLNSIGKDSFDNRDIYSVAEQFVPAHCAGKLAVVVIDVLSKNGSTP